MKVFLTAMLAVSLLLCFSCGRDIAGSDATITMTPPEIGLGSTISQVKQVFGTPDREGYEYHDLGQADDNGVFSYDYSLRYDSRDLTFWLDKSWPRVVTHIDGSL